MRGVPRRSARLIASRISRWERRSDMPLSTLKRFVQATGGELHVVVQYPDGGPVELFVGNDWRHARRPGDFRRLDSLLVTGALLDSTLRS